MRTQTTSAAAEAWSLIGELWNGHKHRLHAIAQEFELSPPQLWALRARDPDNPLPMSELAGALHCDASNVTGIIDRLQHRGLVERHPAEHDRRVKRLVLTDAGCDLRERVLARLATPPSALAELSPEDQEALRDVLARALAR
jgi:DNA-binding MarR family transcriptional regulator